MLQFVKPQTYVPTRSDKHLRARLDRVREERRIPLAVLIEKLPRLLGRTVNDIGQLSDGEMRFVIRMMDEGKVK